MILAFYIEVKDSFDRANLESNLHKAGYAFYDATHQDSYTSGPCALDSLIAIETDLNSIKIE